jgi:hypothetical protein
VTRICFVGNSHLAAIKLGWDRAAAANPGFSAGFFGMPGAGQSNIQVHGTDIRFMANETKGEVFSTTGEKECVDLRTYDALVICGLGLSVAALVRMHRNMRADCMSGLDDVEFVVSSACFRDVAADILKQHQSCLMAREVRRSLAIPVILIPTPHPGRGVLNDFSMNGFRRVTEKGDGETIDAFFDDALRFMSRDGISCLPQPAATKELGIFTRERFSKGSIRMLQSLDTAHADNDAKHMNADYGETVVTEILDHLGKTTAAKP